MIERVPQINQEDSLETEQYSDIQYSDDPVRDYLRKIGQYPLLNAEQEVELAKLIEAGLYAKRLLEADDDSRLHDKSFRGDCEQLGNMGYQAKQTMIESNLRLVVWIAKRYDKTKAPLPLLDLIQEGNIGLSHAVEKFDYEKGFKFSTYATWWIRQSITRAIAEKSRSIRIPVHAHEKLLRIHKRADEFQRENNREPSIEELSELVDMPAGNIIELLNISRAPASLDEPINEDGTEFREVIADESSQSFEDDVVESILREEMREALDFTLNEREKDIIVQRFGLDGKRHRTLDEVGESHGLTRERIRQIQKGVMARLGNSGMFEALRQDEDGERE